MYICTDLNDLSILKFWFKIVIPDKLSNHLIGHTVYFNITIKFSHYMPPLQKCNGSLKCKSFIFIWKYIMWPTKWLEILLKTWILNQNLKIYRSLKFIFNYKRKLIYFNDFQGNFLGAISSLHYKMYLFIQVITAEDFLKPKSNF